MAQKSINILIAEKEFSAKAKKILARSGRVINFGSRAEFFRNLSKADVVVTGLEVKFDKPILDRARRLKLIGSRTTQLRYLDLDECRRRGIKIVNIKADAPALHKTPSTAEETMALILALLRKIPWGFEAIKKGEWDRAKYSGRELSGKTIGLIGFGRLGRLVAGYSAAFGMRALAYDPFVGAAEMKKYGAVKADLPNLLKLSDVVSLHAVYNDSTYKMLKQEHFKLMKPTAVFINTARGEITDEVALLEALKKGWIAGAGIDTLADESPDGAHLINNPLVEYARKNQNLIILPHLGGSTEEATERTQVYISELVVKAIKNLENEAPRLHPAGLSSLRSRVRLGGVGRPGFSAKENKI